MPERPRSLLDDFFDPPDQPVLAVLRGARSLTNPEANAKSRSHGKVTSPETFIVSTGRPEPRGLFSERIFGPVEDLRCACGKYQGEEHAGETCEKCRVTVETNEGRAWRFGHIETGPILHPALIPALADILEMGEEDIRGVLRTEAEIRDGKLTPAAVPEAQFTGVTGLRRAVGEAPAGHWHEQLLAAGFKVDDLFVEAVPVVPPGDRLPVEIDDPRAKIPVDGTVNEAYGQLVYQAGRYRQMVDLGGPDILVANEQARLQEALEATIEQVRAGNEPGGWARLPDDGEVWITTPADTEEEEHFALEQTAPAAALLWLDDETLLEQRGRQLRVRNLPTGDTRTFEAPPYPMRSLHDGLVVFSNPYVLDLGPDDAPADGLAVLDLERETFLDRLPAGIPLYSVANDQPEELFIFDLRHDRVAEIPVGSDRPMPGAYSRDGRYALAVGDGDGGRIVELHTSRVLEDLARLDLRHRAAPFIGEDGTANDEPPEYLRPLEALVGPGALAVRLAEDERWQWLTAAGMVGCGEDVFYRLGFEWEAAAFSPDGEALAVLGPSEEVLLLDARPAEL